MSNFHDEQIQGYKGWTVCKYSKNWTPSGKKICKADFWFIQPAAISTVSLDSVSHANFTLPTKAGETWENYNPSHLPWEVNIKVYPPTQTLVLATVSIYY